MNDQVITADLATVGRASRERLRSLDDTMAALPRRLRVPAAVARDVATAGFGITAFACACAMAVMLGFGPDAALDAGLSGWMFIAVELGLGIGALAKRWARQPDAETAQRWAIAGAIAGAVALVAVVGMIVIAFGDIPIMELASAPTYVPYIRGLTAATLAGSLVLAAAGALYLARRRPAAHGWMIATGIALVAATALAGMRLDLGPLFSTYMLGHLPSPWLRGALTITGTMGLVLAVGGFVLRRRRAV